MKILIEIWPPAPQTSFTFPYESDRAIPIPEVGEQIRGYRQGELPIKVKRRLYHYMPEEIRVRLICVPLEQEDF